MTEQSEETLSSYKKLKTQNDDLLAKINSLEKMLVSETDERQKVEIVAKINTILPKFVPSEDMDSEALRWMLEGLKLAPKANDKATIPDELPGINPKPDTPKINGQEIDPKYEKYMAVMEENPNEEVVSTE